MEKDYIYQLYKQNKIIELEKAFESEFSKQIKTVIIMEPSQKVLDIIITDRLFKLIKAFRATDFDCEPFKDNLLPYMYKDMPKSEKYADAEEVRRFYLRFMAKNFNTYKADFKAQLIEQADLDLGEITSV